MDDCLVELNGKLMQVMLDNLIGLPVQIAYTLPTQMTCGSKSLNVQTKVALVSVSEIINLGVSFLQLYVRMFALSVSKNLLAVHMIQG